MNDFFKDKEGADQKSAPKKEEVKPAKLIAVEALQEIPSYKGKRIPKGAKFSILETAFNKELMKKI